VIAFFAYKMIGKKNSFTRKMSSRTPKLQMAILNQQIKMNDPLVFRLVAHGYRNSFYGQWVIHLTIFDFPWHVKC
jgi:hypothetical protein